MIEDLLYRESDKYESEREKELLYQDKTLFTNVQKILGDEASK